MSDLHLPLDGIRLFHPSGAEVCLSIGGASYADKFVAVNSMIAAGFTAAPVGVEPGEKKETVGYVLRREYENREKNEITPMVDLYSVHPQMTWKFLTVYLNTEADVEAFENTCGLSLAKFPLYEGTAAPQRGATTKGDRFITPVPKPFGVAFKANPKWKEDDAKSHKDRNEVYKVAKSVFVRWCDATPGGTGSGSASNGAKGDPKDREEAADDRLVQRWYAFVGEDPDLGKFNTFLKKEYIDWPRSVKEIVKKHMMSHANAVGWVWSAALGEFENPAQDGGTDIPF